MSIREDFVRPRSDRENAARRAAILDEAEKLLLEAPNQRFSINTVARRLGVSQSTIFLHFRNREDLLTSLYTRLGRNFFETFVGRLHEGMSDRAFCEAFIDTAVAYPGFRLMRPMIMRVLEESLSQDYIHDAVKEIYLYRTAAADKVEELLQLGPGQGRRLMKGFVNLMCGAVQADVGRLLAMDGLDADVKDGVLSFDLRDAFLSGAELLVLGIRQIEP